MAGLPRNERGIDIKVFVRFLAFRRRERFMNKTVYGRNEPYLAKTLTCIRRGNLCQKNGEVVSVTMVIAVFVVVIVTAS